MFTLPHERNDKMVKTMIVEDIKLKLGTFLHVYSHKMCWSMCVCWHSVLQIAKMLCIPTTTTIICDMTKCARFSNTIRAFLPAITHVHPFARLLSRSLNRPAIPSEPLTLKIHFDTCIKARSHI